MKKKRPPEGSPKTHSNGNSTAVQRQRLLIALRNAGAAGLTTIQLRERFDIMMPAARVHELRWMYGYNVFSAREFDRNAQGNRHHCSRYVLLSGRWKGKGRAANG